MRVLTIKLPSSLVSHLTAEFISQSIFNLLIVSSRVFLTRYFSFYLASISGIWAMIQIQVLTWWVKDLQMILLSWHQWSHRQNFKTEVPTKTQPPLSWPFKCTDQGSQSLSSLSCPRHWMELIHNSLQNKTFEWHWKTIASSFLHCLMSNRRNLERKRCTEEGDDLSDPH